MSSQLSNHGKLGFVARTMLYTGAAAFIFASGVLAQMVFPDIFRPLTDKAFGFLDIDRAKELATSVSNGTSDQHQIGSLPTAQKYMDRYLDSYAHVNFSENPGCDEERQKERHEASTLLDAIEASVSDLKEKGEKYREFSRKMRGGYVWAKSAGYDWRAACADIIGNAGTER